MIQDHEAGFAASFLVGQLHVDIETQEEIK